MNDWMQGELSVVLFVLLVVGTARGSEVGPIDMPSVVTLASIDNLSESERRVGEIRIPVSASSAACPSGTKSLRFEIRGTSGKVRVSDVLPSTSQEDIAAGPVRIRLTKKAARGHFDLQLRYVVLPRYGEASVSGDTASKSAASNITADLLPPKATVVSSGTLDRGRGAFFRFEQTARHELGKRHHVSLLVDVDQLHPAEAFIVNVQAHGNEGELVERSMLLIVRCNSVDIEESAIDKTVARYRKVDELRRRMNKLLSQADELRNNVAFPQLGFGTKRANILKEAQKVHNEYEESLALIREQREVVPAAEFVWHRERLWQAQHRYKALSRQADEIRGTSGFPYFGLGSALARTQADADKAKEILDQCEVAIENLGM